MNQNSSVKHSYQKLIIKVNKDARGKMNELLEPVVSIKGIGAETATTLHEMGIYTVFDLLEHLPYRYEDYRLKDLETVEHEERVTIEGTSP